MTISRTLSESRLKELHELARHTGNAAGPSEQSLIRQGLVEVLEAEEVEWRRAERYMIRLFHIEAWCTDAVQGMRSADRLLNL